MYFDIVLCYQLLENIKNGCPVKLLQGSPPFSSPTLVGFLLSQLLEVKGVSWVREALANHGDPMVAALVLHSRNDVAGGNRGYPR